MNFAALQREKEAADAYLRRITATNVSDRTSSMKQMTFNEWLASNRVQRCVRRLGRP